MNYELLLRCVQHVTALQLSSLGGVNPELVALADDLTALLAAEAAPVAEEAPAEEAPAEEVSANE